MPRRSSSSPMESLQNRRATSGNIGANGPGFYRARAVPTPSGAMSPLLFAAREGNQEMARILLDAKADINLPSANGSPPLVVAITNNHIGLAIALLEKGANPNLADKFWKRTPLYAADRDAQSGFHAGIAASVGGCCRTDGVDQGVAGQGCGP